MQANYNSSTYLSPSDLNAIESKLAELTMKIQEKIFEGKTSPLKLISLNDDLNRKTLYLYFPRNLYEYIDNTEEIDILRTDNNGKISYVYSNGERVVKLTYGSKVLKLYQKYDSETNPRVNLIRVKLPKKFGNVTYVDVGTLWNTDMSQYYWNREVGSNFFYSYIGIYENEDIIPDYVTKEWVVNEIPYLQDIDRIEKGIENIGSYFEKPDGWITPVTWFKTVDINNQSDNSIETAYFSYRDINRWITDLNLIDSAEMDNVTIWNTYASQYYWS